jgi:two-component system LytT family response regulator
LITQKPYTDKITCKLKNRMLVISTVSGFEIINLDTVYYLQSKNCYTTFFFSENKKIIASKNLGHFEKRLSNYEFLRIHHSTIININKVSRYKNDESRIILTDNTRLSVSRTRKTFLLTLLKKLC